MTYHVVVPAAGSGSRFGSDLPKQYLRLGAKPILQHTLERLSAGFPGAIVHVVLAPDDRWFQSFGDMPDVNVLRCGGATRAQTVRNALRLLGSTQDDDWVAVHDAVRPCLDAASALRLQHELADHPVGGLLAIPVSDTLKRVDETLHVSATQSREHLWRAQTPQMFRYSILTAALDRDGAEGATDEAEAVEQLGLTPRIVVGSVRNVKITFAEDLELAAAILATGEPA